MGRLSDLDRALIDAAVAAGRVRVIPRGVSAFPTPQWNGSDLIYPMDEAATGAVGFRRPPPPEIAKRRDRIAELHAQGRNVHDIAAALQTSVWTIRNDHALLGLRCIAAHPAGPPRRPMTPEVEVRRKRVVPMRCGGMTKRAIAEAIGVPQAVIEHDIKMLLRAKLIPEGIDPQGKARRRKAA